MSVKDEKKIIISDEENDLPTEEIIEGVYHLPGSPDYKPHNETKITMDKGEFVEPITNSILKKEVIKEKTIVGEEESVVEKRDDPQEKDSWPTEKKEELDAVGSDEGQFIPPKVTKSIDIEKGEGKSKKKYILIVIVILILYSMVKCMT